MNGLVEYMVQGAGFWGRLIYVWVLLGHMIYIQGYGEPQLWAMGYTLFREVLGYMLCEGAGNCDMWDVGTHTLSVCRLVGYMT